MILRKNAYLDELGLSREDYCGNFVKEKKFQRFIERNKYGFDYRDVFNMHISFAEWLYSHMRMYREHSVHNESIHRIEFLGNTYTIGEAIDHIINFTGEHLNKVYAEEFSLSSEEENKLDEDLKSVGQLFLEIMRYCWL